VAGSLGWGGERGGRKYRSLADAAGLWQLNSTPLSLSHLQDEPGPPPHAHLFRGQRQDHEPVRRGWVARRAARPRRVARRRRRRRRVPRLYQAPLHRARLRDKVGAARKRGVQGGKDGPRRAEAPAGRRRLERRFRRGGRRSRRRARLGAEGAADDRCLARRASAAPVAPGLSQEAVHAPVVVPKRQQHAGDRRGKGPAVGGGERGCCCKCNNNAVINGKGEKTPNTRHFPRDLRESGLEGNTENVALSGRLAREKRGH